MSTPTSISTRPPKSVRKAGFRKITFRGDTDFSQTKHLDGWDRDGHRFIFGIDAMSNLVAIAESLPPEAFRELERPPRYTIKTAPRQARERHKEHVVSRRNFDTLKLLGEEVAEFAYRPVACKKAYRVVVLRKKLVVEKGQLWLFRPDRFFFYITNDRTSSASEIVFSANDRCDQENLNAQLKGGVQAFFDAGGQPGEQLGVHGDGEPGVEPEGVERVGPARVGPMVGEVP